jgi:hypothetical protein
MIMWLWIIIPLIYLLFVGMLKDSGNRDEWLTEMLRKRKEEEEANVSRFLTSSVEIKSGVSAPPCCCGSFRRP